MEVPDLDVVIVGAGLSGIAAAHHVLSMCPDKRLAVLEGRASLGGTWDLFKYPGIRSDSDMYTLGYSFRPWRKREAIASGQNILEYLQQTAKETGVADHIQYNKRVEEVSWSTKARRWTVSVRDTVTDTVDEVTTRFLWACTGYYRYDSGYTPDFPGAETFAGKTVHPQFWPPDLDVGNKRVVVIGSGATAMTLVPELAKAGAQVTMLQRSPTYVVALPRIDHVAEVLKAVLPANLAHVLVRWKNILITQGYYRFSRWFPGASRRLMLAGVQRILRDRDTVAQHFEPSYDLWDQRLCVLPEGDLLRDVRDGRVQVVTEHIDTFNQGGIRLRSGAQLDADIVVTATGLQLQFLGGAKIHMDGQEVRLGDLMMYRGAMLCGLPNAAMCIGYTNASWTLKCELACVYVCRVLQHMAAHNHEMCTPRPGSSSMTMRPAFDLNSGYVRRAADAMPRQGDTDPWRIHNSYLRDLRTLKHAPMEDGVMEYA